MDSVTRATKLQFVKEQLAQFGGEKKLGDDFSFILCPFHAEKTPSGRIFHSADSYSPGYYKCYGCGARKTWNDLADAIGLQPFGKSRPKDEYALLIQLTTSQVEESKDERIKFKAVPEGATWRGFDYELLKSLGAKLCKTYNEDHKFWTKPMLYLPVIVQGKTRGYIKAQLKKEKGSRLPSYINKSGNWSKTYGLFPYDPAVRLMKKLRSSTIVLVEGPRDALRLISLGIPAVCILGTQSWSEKKAKLLELAGVDHVILMMDGDCAGVKATELIKPTLKSMFKRTTVVKLWSIKDSPYIPFADKEEPTKAAKEAGAELWDPGNCPKWILKKLKRKYFAEE